MPTFVRENSPFPVKKRVNGRRQSLVGSLTVRMSSIPSGEPIHFTAHFSSISVEASTTPHLMIPFTASSYDLSSSFPYTGLIPIDRYSLAPKGTLQLLIKTSETTAKLFLIPYDYSDMPCYTKTFLRSLTYAVRDGRQVLKDAVHMQIRKSNKRIWLVKDVRVVFSLNEVGGEEKNCSEGPGLYIPFRRKSE